MAIEKTNKINEKNEVIESENNIEKNEENNNFKLDSMWSIKWQKEIQLHSIINSGIIVEGNVNDMQFFLGDEGNSNIVPIDRFFYYFLKQMGYKTIVFFNHIEGFFNKFSKEEYSNFMKIATESSKESKEDYKGKDSDHSRFGESLSLIRAAMKNKTEPVAIIMLNVSRYIASPNNISESDNFFYSRLSLATNKIEHVKSSDGTNLHSIVFLIAEKVNDIPAWFYLNNPLIKTITIPLPDMALRKMYIESFYENINYGIENEDEETIAKNKDSFVSYTDGFTLTDLDSLRILMNNQKLPVSKVSQAVSKFKYGEDKNPWEDESLLNNLDSIESKLKERVKGQDAAILKASEIIKSAVLGLAGLQHSSSKSKPRGVMFLAGPTGTGKTELAKAISEWVFKSDTHVVRFDMSEYSQSHTDQKLLGAPPGYVGYEQGGQLTEAIKRQPFSVLLFDEIEKAHPSILDKFLQILEDGRMTDGKGETVYFSDTLIIFTSNLGMFKEIKDENGMTTRVPTVKYGDDGCNEIDKNKSDEMYKEYSKKILDAINDFFTLKIERPEIKNRIGENFIVYDYISKSAAKLIANKQLKTIKQNLKSMRNVELEFSDKALETLYNEMCKDEHMEQGGRGVGNVIESIVIRPLSTFMVENKIYKNDKILVKDFLLDKSNWKIIK